MRLEAFILGESHGKINVLDTLPTGCPEELLRA